MRTRRASLSRKILPMKASLLYLPSRNLRRWDPSENQASNYLRVHTMRLQIYIYGQIGTTLDVPASGQSHLTLPSSSGLIGVRILYGMENAFTTPSALGTNVVSSRNRERERERKKLLQISRIELCSNIELIRVQLMASEGDHAPSGVHFSLFFVDQIAYFKERTIC